MRIADWAKLIDSTNLKVDATVSDMMKLCRNNVDYGFRAACVHLARADDCVRLAKYYSGVSNFKVAVVVDFPLGSGGASAKLIQAESAQAIGASEIDTVINLAVLKCKKDRLFVGELKLVTACLPTKVILETGALTEEEIRRGTRLAVEAGAFCIKTSTGVNFNTDIKAKGKHVGIIKDELIRINRSDVIIKASGGIKTIQDLDWLKLMGADIYGLSDPVRAVESMKKEGMT